jgi:hypothetical protein
MISQPLEGKLLKSKNLRQLTNLHFQKKDRLASEARFALKAAFLSLA